MGLNSHVCENGQVSIASGDRLTIETSAEFLRIVSEALLSSSEVEIEFEPEVEFDITGMQILCSGCKSAARDGKIFKYKGPQPTSLTKLINATGAERHAVCKHNSDSTCIWFGGTA